MHFLFVLLPSFPLSSSSSPFFFQNLNPEVISLRTANLPPAGLTDRVSLLQHEEEVELTRHPQSHSQYHSASQQEAHEAGSSSAQSKQPSAISCTPRRGQP